MLRPLSPACLAVQVPTKTSGKSYQICGIINQLDDTTLEICELPVRKWTQVRRGGPGRGDAGAVLCCWLLWVGGWVHI
jgi:hypothetical protein